MKRPHIHPTRAAADYGWLLAVAMVCVTVILVVILLPEAGVDTNPTRTDQTLNVVAASGIEGWDVEPFCNDPATVVLELLAPDADGKLYQLARTRDGALETVQVNVGPAGPTGTHYFDTTAGQQSEPALVTARALECIEDKAR